ncbi:hypothetical protein BH18CHL1_BH18CHL1_05260 [soil metagenome]|nr:universal stress protein [Chloroflexota bacterium]
MPHKPQAGLYQHIVMGVNGASTDDLVVGLGCEMATDRKTDLVALHVVEVDWRHDLSEDMAATSERASGVLDRAELVAERQGRSLRTELLQARDVAAALVDEALELGADLLIIGLPYRQRFGGDFAIGSTIPYVFQNATCSVIVVREPMPAEGAQRPETLAVSYGTTG